MTEVADNQLRVGGALAVWLVSLVWLSVGTPVATAANGLRMIAMDGQPAPGGVMPEIFRFLGSPLINDRGDVAFSASLQSNNGGKWIYRAGQLQSIYVGGDPAPDIDPSRPMPSSGTHWALSAAGDAAVSGSIASPTSSDFRYVDGVWIEDHGVLRNVALEGARMPGLASNFVIFEVTGVRLGAAGHYAVSGHLDNTDFSFVTSEAAIWTGLNGGAPTLLMQTGQQVPGAANGVTFNPPQHPLGGVNGAGQVVVNSFVRGPGITNDRDQGVWLASGEVFTPLAWEGDPVPGHEQRTISYLVGRSLNDAGQVVLDAEVVGPTTGDGRRGALLVAGPLGRRTVVMGGEPTPLPGYTYGYGFSTSAINGRGEVAFASNITDGMAWTTAIWSEGLGGLHLVAKDGDQAPGLAPGQSFGPIGSGSSELVMNEAGQVAFIADYGGRSYGTGIWAEDRSGELQLIAHVGQQIELGPGDVRSITELTFVGNSGLEDGYGASFNNRGQVAFGALLSGGGSAVFVSNLVAVPEPSTLSLAISLVVAMRFGSPKAAFRQHMPS